MEPVVTPESSGKFPPSAKKLSIARPTKSRADSGHGANADAGPLMPIGVLAARSACPIDTIRFYEKIGILPHPARTEGGHRLYSPSAAQRLIFVRRTRALGFTLDDVRALLRLADQEQSACAAAKSMAQTHLIDIRAKIADLAAMEATLTALIVQCDDNGGTECPLIQVLCGPEL